MISIPGPSSTWRAILQPLQQNFRQAAEVHPQLRHVVLQALDEEGSLPRSLAREMQAAGGWSAGEMRPRWEVPEGDQDGGNGELELASGSYMDVLRRDSPAKVGYLFGDPSGIKRFEFLAERAWLALPGTPDGKSQAYPQPRPLERWMAFVYRQLARASSCYLSAED